MLRDGQVDGLSTEAILILVLIGVVTSTCEPEVVMASSRNAAAAKAGLHNLDISLSCLLPTLN